MGSLKLRRPGSSPMGILFLSHQEAKVHGYLITLNTLPVHPLNQEEERACVCVCVCTAKALGPPSPSSIRASNQSARNSHTPSPLLSSQPPPPPTSWLALPTNHWTKDPSLLRYLPTYQATSLPTYLHTSAVPWILGLRCFVASPLLPSQTKTKIKIRPPVVTSLHIAR